MAHTDTQQPAGEPGGKRSNVVPTLRLLWLGGASMKEALFFMRKRWQIPDDKLGQISEAWEAMDFDLYMNQQRSGIPAFGEFADYPAKARD